jgi:hypothetical protein
VGKRPRRRRRTLPIARPASPPSRRGRGLPSGNASNTGLITAGSVRSFERRPDPNRSRLRTSRNHGLLDARDREPCAGLSHGLPNSVSAPAGPCSGKSPGATISSCQPQASWHASHWTAAGPAAVSTPSSHPPAFPHRSPSHRSIAVSNRKSVSFLCVSAENWKGSTFSPAASPASSSSI